MYQLIATEVVHLQYLEHTNSSWRLLDKHSIFQNQKKKPPEMLLITTIWPIRCFIDEILTSQ